MNEKAKHEPLKNSFLNRISFLFLWIVLSTGIGIAANGLFNWLIYFIPQTFGVSITELTSPSWRLSLIFTLFHSLVLSSVQLILLRRGFGRWLKGWVWASLLGSVLASLPNLLLFQFNLQEGLQFQNNSFFFLQALSTLLYTLPQVWILRNYVQKAWLYSVIAVPSNLFAVSLTMYGFANRLTLEPIASVLAATVFGLMWLWFFRETPNQEKAKVGEAMSHERLEDRIADEDRLEEVDMRQEREEAQ
jgi:hypothetical protein